MDQQNNTGEHQEVKNHSIKPPKRFSQACLVIIICAITVPVIVLLALPYLWRFTNKPLVLVSIKNVLWDNTEFIDQLQNLELAQRETTEFVERLESAKFNIPWWGPVEPSSAKYEVRFKALYVYFVSAERDKWKFAYKDGVAYIDAPKLESRASVDTNTIKGRFEGGWLVPDEVEKLRKLEKSVTSIANKKARQNRHLNIVRETCRKKLGEFIYTWFLKGKYPVKDIRVKFADEENYGYLDEQEKKLRKPRL